MNKLQAKLHVNILSGVIAMIFIIYFSLETFQKLNTNTKNLKNVFQILFFFFNAALPLQLNTWVLLNLNISDLKYKKKFKTYGGKRHLSEEVCMMHLIHVLK